jgi:hypothetical protein
VLLAAWPSLAGAQDRPSVSITAPQDNATVSGPAVRVTVDVENFELVAANTATQEGQGHVHLFVDTEPGAAGAAIPTGQENIIHMGAAPFDSREVQLDPGRHTIHAVLADSAHVALDPLARDSVTFTVSAGAAPAPTRPAATGDGSLAGGGPGLGLVVGLVLAALAVGRRIVLRKA